MVNIMKLSLKQLNHYVDVKEYFTQPENLAARLTHLGLEVEGLHQQAAAFEHIVVGRLIDVQPHPKADKLTLCQVDIGSTEPQQIVCGATNHKAGDLVAVAKPGAVLPGGLKIKTSKIRDIESRGMLCSAQELGLGEDADGILILNPNKASGVGQAFSQYAGLDDTILDISITPNRGDCLSHLGVARELRACNLKSVNKHPDLEQLKAKLCVDRPAMQGPIHRRPTQPSVRIVSDECPHYLGQYIKGVRIGPSPAWLQKSLSHYGVKTHNNVVDITNYILHDLGQPLHAFDAQRLHWPLEVGPAEAGQKLQLLDESECKLKGGELLIRDSKQLLALAGVMGGLSSGIQNNTCDLFIESAYFLPSSVQRTSRQHKIITDSSYRFARGVDPEGTLYALLRATQMILQLAGGQLEGPVVEVRHSKLTRPSITIHESQIKTRLGLSEAPDFSQRLQGLGFQVHKQTEGAVWQCTPPSWRSDISRDVDLIEEYARLVGYDQIASTLPPLKTPPQGHDASYIQQQHFCQAFLAAGFQQALNPSFIGAHWQHEVGLQDEELVFLKNPINDENNTMRRQVLPGLLKNLVHNCRRDLKQGCLFELGPVFEKASASKAKAPQESSGGYQQKPQLGAVLWGQLATPWPQPAPAVYKLKSAIEQALELMQLAYQWKNYGAGVADVPPYLHTGQCAQLILQGRCVGCLGTLHPLLKKKYKLRVDVAAFEMDVLPQFMPRARRVARVSKFPRVERDMAFVLPKTVSAAELLRAIQSLRNKNLYSLYVFDVYEGDPIPPHHTSLALRFVYQSFEGTLKDNDVANWQAQALAAVQKKWPEASLRSSDRTG